MASLTRPGLAMLATIAALPLLAACVPTSDNEPTCGQLLGTCDVMGPAADDLTTATVELTQPKTGDTTGVITVTEDDALDELGALVTSYEPDDTFACADAAVVTMTFEDVAGGGGTITLDDCGQDGVEGDLLAWSHVVIEQNA